jgi:hypothetical protein
VTATTLFCFFGPPDPRSRIQWAKTDGSGRLGLLSSEIFSFDEKRSAEQIKKRPSQSKNKYFVLVCRKRIKTTLRLLLQHHFLRAKFCTSQTIYKILKAILPYFSKNRQDDFIDPL